MSKAAVLLDLKRRVGTQEISNREFFAAPSFSSGVARGIVVELIGNAKIDWLVSLFSMHPEHFIFWCESGSAQPNPLAFVQRGIELDRIKFINSKNDISQPLRLAIESQLYPFIVAPSAFHEIKTFQRFHLLTEKNKSTLFLLAQKDFSQAWPISLQLEINHTEDDFEILVQKQKHGVSG